VASRWERCKAAI